MGADDYHRSEEELPSKPKGAEFSRGQMVEMMSRTRSWTLNNPSGPLPYLPLEYSSESSDFLALQKSLPPYKKPKKIVAILIWLKII